MLSDFKVVIADESRFLKNAQAKRTRASLPIFQLNMQSCSVELLLYHDQLSYISRIGMYQGASNHEELHNLMKATVMMIRRLKKDVLSELHVKRRQQVFLDLAEKEMRQINALLFCEVHADNPDGLFNHLKEHNLRNLDWPIYYPNYHNFLLFKCGLSSCLGFLKRFVG